MKSKIAESIVELLEKEKEEANQIEDPAEKAKKLNYIIDEFKALVSGLLKMD